MMQRFGWCFGLFVGRSNRFKSILVALIVWVLSQKLLVADKVTHAWWSSSPCNDSFTLSSFILLSATCCWKSIPAV